MDLNDKIEARRKELAEEAARAREEDRLLKQARDEVLEKEAADRLRKMGVDLDGDGDGDDDLALEPEINRKIEELITQRALKSIPGTEWFAIAVFSLITLSVASENLIWGLILGSLTWLGYKHAFEKQKEIVRQKIPSRKSTV